MTGSRLGSRGLVVIGLFAAGLALRAQQIAIGPLIPRLRDELDLTHAGAGLVAAVPIWTMSLIALPAIVWTYRIGPRRAAAIAMVLVALSGALRAGAPDADVLILLTIPIGIGMGLALTALPGVARDRLRDRPALATGAYVTGIALGSILVGVSAVPLAQLFGSWRGPMLVYAIAHLILIAVWLALHPPSRLTATDAPPSLRARPPRMLWRVVVLFSIQSMLFFALATWLPTAYVERGWSEASAALVVAVLLAGSLVGTLLVAGYGDRIGTRRAQLLVATVAIAAGMVGLAAMPALAAPWAALTGVGFGALYPLAMTLPLDIGLDQRQVATITGITLAAGYLIAALGPPAVGWLRVLTGDFGLSSWILAGAALILVPVAISHPLRSAAEQTPGPG